MNPGGDTSAWGPPDSVGMLLTMVDVIKVRNLDVEARVQFNVWKDIFHWHTMGTWDLMMTRLLTGEIMLNKQNLALNPCSRYICNVRVMGSLA